MRTQLLALAILLSSSAIAGFASQVGDQCYAAYWDGRKQQALSACRSAAVAGDAEAQFQYGLILWSGHDRTSDHKAAIDWLRRSARQGHALAQVSLGRFLSDEGIETALHNPTEAYAWFVTAGELDAASRLKARLTPAQTQDATQLAAEYRSKYAKK